ncbi:MAG TPA: DMT family transporter [Pyrinomonadaceae bacterium]|nr:DMT family transporter [Pyrinomonadaceae bacterium]
MFLSTLFFALANVFVKEISHLPAMEVVLFRCLFGTAFSLYGLKKANADWKGSNRTQLFLRGFFGTAALFCFFVTVQNIPLASAMTIQYLSPIFTSIIAIFMLKESVRPMQWIFYAIAFAGVLFIGQVDLRVSPLYLALGIFSAFGSGMAYNLVRNLKEKEHPLTVVLHFQLVGLIAGGVFTIFNWQTPAATDWIYLLLIGITSQLGQIFLTNALQKEKAASVSIIIYSGLIYGISIGWIFYGEGQTIYSLFGMFLVVFGVILSLLYNKRRISAAALEVTKG